MNCLALIALLGCCLALAVAQTCDQSAFNQCVVKTAAALKTDLGIQEIPEDANKFAQMVIDAESKKGYDGFSIFCKIIKDLSTCLGDQKDVCITVDNLKSTFGLDDTNAGLYVMYARQYLYQCTTKAYDIFEKNLVCMGKVYIKHKDDYAKCYKNEAADLTADPTCMKLQKMVTCISKFYVPCGKKTKNAICRMLDYSLQTLHPDCKFNCYF